MAANKIKRYLAAFNGTTILNKGTNEHVSRVDWGRIEIDDRGLIVSDPIASEADVVPIRLPIGTYELDLAILTSTKDRRVAAVRCVKQHSNIVEYKAKYDKTLYGKSLHNVIIDSGMVMFCNGFAWQHWQQCGEDQRLALIEETDADELGLFRPGNLLTNHPEAALKICSSGPGDGRYRLVGAYSDPQTLVGVVLDFDILFKDSYTTIDLPLPYRGTVEHKDLKKLEIDFKLMEKWRSRPVDPLRECAVQYKSTNPLVFDLKLELIDAKGVPIPTAVDSIQPAASNDFEYWLNYSAESIPEGSYLRIKILTARKPL